MGVRPTEIKIVVTGLKINTFSNTKHEATHKNKQTIKQNILASINLLINFKGRETGRGKSQGFQRCVKETLVKS